jgi:YlmC/YmxH family sporulation protein
MRLSELQEKDIINVSDGKKIGNIIDICVDENGNMDSLVVENYKFLVSKFTSNKEIEIKWNQIEKIGQDVILVRLVY